MHYSLALALALATASLSVAQKVVSLDIQKPQHSTQGRHRPRLARRQTISETLVNGQALYYANISVGTPPQSLSLQIDTGSSDVWMTSSQATFCLRYPGQCTGGTFDSDSSSTFEIVSQDFEIQYVDNTGSSGDYFTDNLSIGPEGSQVTITNQQMGLATDTDIGTGIIGVGFAADEAVCSQSSPFSTCDTYPSIIEQLVSQNKINSKAYSLWLNDLDSNSGSLLFGGIDSDKYMGDLITLPIQPDAGSNSITSFTVAWTNLTLGTSEGPQVGFFPDGLVQPVILDSGTTLTLVPNDIADKIFSEFGAQEADPTSGIYLAPCSLGTTSTATLDFSFGGAGGPTIRVPVNELLLSGAVDNYGYPLTINGEVACELGIMAAGENPILFGDTFLRSAYVVYDLDNEQVSLAQTNFNATSSNVQEIAAGPNGIPNVSSTASSAKATQSASADAGFLGGLGGIFGAKTTAAVASPTYIFASGSVPPIGQFTGPNSNNPEPAPSSGNAAVASLHQPMMLRSEGLVMGILLAAAAAVGGALVVL